MARILSIDDDPDLQDLVAHALRGQGFVVEQAFTGLEGRRMAAASPPDVVLLDLMLPGLSGREVLAILKNEPATRDIPVIVMSAHADIEENDLRSLGAYVYLRKPVRLDALIKLLKDLTA